MRTVLKYTLLTSLISLLVVGFGTILVVDKFMAGQSYYWQLKDVLQSILIILTSIVFVSAGVLAFLTLKCFNRENHL
jgi:hypothetical protein